MARLSSTSVAAFIFGAGWDLNLPGTYTVNADGTGTMTLAGLHRRHFVIGAGGNELKYIGTDPDTRHRNRRFHGEAIADNSSEAVRDQPSRFTVWRLIVFSGVMTATVQLADANANSFTYTSSIEIFDATGILFSPPAAGATGTRF